MAYHIPSPWDPRPTVSTPAVLVSAVFFVLALLPLSLGLASAQPVPSTPLLIQAALLPAPMEQITVVGDGFSPGGIVYITVTDRAGADVRFNGWTIASTGAYGPHGSTDPSLGYVEAGTINDVVQLDSSLVFGPHGSQDPARDTNFSVPTADYGSVADQDRPQTGTSTTQDSLCDFNLEVQAFDAQTLIRSDRIEVNSNC